VPRSRSSFLWTQQTTLFLFLVIVFSFFSYVLNYTYPPYLFWDENYFLASAQKYLNGIFFMEPHPPLGKLFIAAGEWLLNANPIDNSFIGTDYATTLPPGFSFAGYRLFPVLFAWGSAPIFFLIMRLLTRNNLFALLLSFLYLFDNALIVHFRGAMLDSMMIFFVLLAVLAFLLLLEKKKFILSSLLFGTALAGIATTKILGLALLLLIPALWLILRTQRHQWRTFLLWAGIPFCILYITIWQIHFSLALTVKPTLPNAGYYQASTSSKQILNDAKAGSLLAFPVMLQDSWKFLGHYEAGVPRLDLCKPGENGSPWFLWPFGGKSINYRWETPDSLRYQYLYLQVNPVIWAVGLLGVILSAVLLLASWISSPKMKLQEGYLLTIFLGIYLSYMYVMSTLDRVMYLYHYFIPLLFSFLLFALACREIKRIGNWRIGDSQKTIMLLGLATMIFFSYQLYRPLTYYEPMSHEQVQMRAVSDYWDLRCVGCPQKHPLVRPR